MNATGDGADSDASTAASPADETLTAGSVEAATATLTIANYAGAWWLKRTTPSDTTCKSKGTAKTESLTSLSGNTSYTFKAYSDSACTTELASETFLTKPGKPTKPSAAAGAGSGKLTVTASVTGGGTLSKWQYKKKEGAGNFDGSWTDISSTQTSLSHTVTGLTDGTDYQFKVRAVNATGDGADSDASTAASPADETLTAGSVEAATATLTIANYAGAWWLKRTTPSDTTCKSKGTAKTESLTSLSGNTSYTFKAYSDSACTTALASETFLTKPGKPTKPSAAAGAGSGKLTVTASVTGGGTLSKWQYKKKEGAGNFDGSWTDISSTQTSLSHTVTGLTDGTSYQFKVRAVNATGDGADSDASTAASPADETLTAGSVEAATATLTIANYAGAWWLKRTTPSDTTCKSKGTAKTESLTSLSGNTSYTFKAYGDSACTTALASETFLTKPGKPTKPSAAAGAGSGKLTVTASVTGGGTLSKWQYKKKEGAGNFDGSWTDISSTQTSLSHTVTGLTDGTSYQFKVRAVNATGDGADSDASTAASPADETLTAGSVEAATATLTIANYAGAWWLKRTTPSDTTCKSKGTAKTESLTSLSGNTSYTFKAYSDSACTTELASETFLTKPGKPTKPSAAAGAGSGKLTVTASVTGGGTLSKWQYKKKEGAGNFDGSWTDISSTQTSLSHTVTGLTDGTDYQFKVRAVNATGDGADSDASTAASPADETLTAGSVEAATATLTIANYAGAWWLKRTTPSDTTCKSKGTAKTESLTSLSGNTSYTFKAYGDSACTTALASETFLTKPGKPTKPSAAAGAGSGKLTVTASVTGGGTLSKWQYKKKEGAGNFDGSWTDISSTQTSLSHTVTGLTDGTDYQFKVRAVNATGDGADSDASTAASPADETLTASSVEAATATLTIANYAGAWWLKRTTPSDTTCKSKGTAKTESLTSLSGNTSYTFKAYSDSACTTALASETFLTKPGKPTKPSAAAGAGSGKLTVTASVTGGGTLSKWQYKKKEGAGNFDGSWTDISSTQTSLSHTVTGLTDGTSYQFKVRAVNATGDGADSDASTAASPADETLTAGSVEAATATLTIANYAGAWWLKRTTPSDTTCKSKGTAKTESLTSLSGNTSYTFKAYSDSACTTALASETFLTKPGKPTKPSAAAGAGSGKLTVTASVTGGGTLSKWQYKKKEGAGNFDGSWTDISSTQTSLSHTVTGLTDGTSYQFKVRAVNATGDGADSDASTAASPADETLTASSVEAATATLTIANYAGAWWLKRTTPSDTTCKSKGTAKTESLTSLSGNTSYTFKAYSDSACTTALASETFLTKPGKPTKPSAAAGAGSGKLTVTASVTGGGTLSKWQYKKKEGAGNFDGSWTDISSTQTSLSHTVTGLTDGTDYQFKVRAVNATGDGADSDASTAASPADETLTASSVEAATATLTIANYAGAWWLKRTTPSDTTCKSKGTAKTESLTSLSGNTSYTFKAYGDSACTTALASETFLTKPGKPTKPSAAAGAGSGKLTVTASVTGGGTLSKWQYKKKEGAGNFDGSWTDISSTQTSLSHTVTGLTDGTSYQFKVRAVNATGDGADSDASTAASPADETLTAGSVEAATATLTIANYAGAWWLKRTTPSDTTCKSKGTAKTESLTSLSGNTSYTFKAYSDSACTTALASETFLTKPGKPTKPSAAAGAGSGKLTVTASVTGGGTLSKWQYKKKEGAGNFDGSWTDISSTQTSLSHTVTGLTDGTSYQFKVRAVNATGDGADSDASTAASPADETLTASSVEAATATLTIANYAGAWWLKRTTPSDTTCKSKGTAKTESLTSLSGNTSYTFKAYSDSACTTALASETFLTKPGKPTKPSAAAGAGSGKLTVTASVTGGGTLSKWQYKKKEGPATSTAAGRTSRRPRRPLATR